MNVSAHIWTVTDGHAGNRRQADALAAALSDQPARAITLLPSALARALAPRRFFGAQTQLGDAFADALQGPVPALAIGCGRQGALATRLLREHGSQVVQILDPRMDPRHWDLVIAPQHDGLRGANVLSPLGSLNPVDDLWLKQAREHFAGLATLPAPRTAVLVGGSSRHSGVDVAAVTRLADCIDRLLEEHGGSLMLTGSRRTDPEVHAMLRKRYRGNAHLLWLDAADGDNPYPGVLAWADRIICTADSVNMVSEACATRVPVFVDAPASASGRPRRFLDALLERGRIRALDADAQPFPVTPLRETARIAAEVAQRLGWPA